MRIMVTGGAGFIGSALVRMLAQDKQNEVVVVDRLTYAGSLASLSNLADGVDYRFEPVDIRDGHEVRKLMQRYKPNKIMHLAAETHVDRSIDSSRIFMESNIMGTFNLLESAYELYGSLSEFDRGEFVFVHVSTDEVYGDLGATAPAFAETSPYKPSSPYSASKASSDHLVRAWHRTYGLPAVVTNSSNNYGPYQHPEKLIPKTIHNALKGVTIPVYGSGRQIRDWIFVDDHVKALTLATDSKFKGETFNIGGGSEVRNIDIVQMVCEILDELKPNTLVGSYRNLIQRVTDRPGHDFRYAVDSRKTQVQLGWKPEETFKSGLYKTVQWYLLNESWLFGCR